MNILIFQPMLKQYRVPLFNCMNERLSELGHELRVVSGSPPEKELTKGDNILKSNGYSTVEKSNWLFGEKVHILHNFMKHILWADFIITEQANKHFHNYILISLKMIGLRKFAYWGHGQNRQGNSSSYREKVKKQLANYCDWWFAYTQGVGRYVASLGFPEDRITILNNSIDTSEFKMLLAAQSDADVTSFKLENGIGPSNRVGLYCGSLYGEKKIDFLLNSARLIHKQNPDFILLVVGSGKDKALVDCASRDCSFIKYLGPLFGKKKALAFRSSEIFVCPGLVGLAVLDAFTAALPLFTTDIPEHSPEIEYLENNINGRMVPADINLYSQAIVSIFANHNDMARLRNNARLSSEKYSIENMAGNFVKGILQAINLCRAEKD